MHTISNCPLWPFIRFAGHGPAGESARIETADERADAYECVNEYERVDEYGRVNECERSMNTSASTDMNGSTDGKRDGERAERRHRDNAAARRPSCSAAT